MDAYDCLYIRSCPDYPIHGTVSRATRYYGQNMTVRGYFNILKTDMTIGEQS